MFGLIAYVPYAAVGYCVAAVAADVWPTLQSALSDSSQRASRHGMDGEWPAARRACDPGATRNQSPQRSDTYCFNTATGRIEGQGTLDGVSPPPGSVLQYTDEDGRETAKIKVSGDNTIYMLVCHVPGGTFSAGGPGTGDPGTPDFDPYDPGGRGECGPRRQGVRGAPMMRRADCPPSKIWRNNDPNRLNRKRSRWG
jgi:hypothetical protein